ACAGKPAGIVGHIGDLKDRPDIDDAVVTDGHVRDPAQGTALRLVLGREQDGVAVLTESAPAVFEKVPLDQHSLSVLQFEQVLHNERMAVAAAGKPRLSSPPDQGFEEVVAPHLDVGWRGGSRTAAEENIFARRFQEIIDDLEWPARSVPSAAAQYLRVGARPNPRRAVKIGKKRVYDR